jgi:hypothetical protein
MGEGVAGRSDRTVSPHAKLEAGQSVSEVTVDAKVDQQDVGRERPDRGWDYGAKRVEVRRFTDSPRQWHVD